MRNKEKSKFKVMSWLRKVREENAKETEGMTPEERVAFITKKAQWFFDNHPEYSKEREIHAVGEKKAFYTVDEKRK